MTPASGPRLRPQAHEVVVALVLLALAFGPLVGLLIRVRTTGGVVTGGDGFLVADPLQYLTWLREASGSIAVENLYDLRGGPHSFVHPGVVAAGLLHLAGLGLVASYAAFKPVAVLSLVAGAAAICRRFLARASDQALALVLALFFASPVAALVGWAAIGGQGTKYRFDFVSGELWSGTYLWGYVFTGIAVGLMPLALLAYERGRAGGGSRRWLAASAAAGLLSAWLQPWQGITLVLILAGAELVSVRRGHRVRDAVADLAGPVVAVALPLTYYLALSKLDESWTLAGQINDFPRWPWYVTVLGLAPLGLPALLAYRLPAPDWGAIALRVWPLAGLVVFYQPLGTFPFHAFQGLTIPLAVMAVMALRAWLGERRLSPALAIAAVVVLCAAGTAYRANELREAVVLERQPFVLDAGERAALRYMEAAGPEGGVLTPVYSGIVVPAYTGRETWIGAGSWTPDFERRRLLTERLFSGRMPAGQARAVVRASGARFLYVDCHDRGDIGPSVRAFADPPRRFGCASVYRVR